MSTTTLKTDSLAFALTGAAQALTQVKTGTALPRALTVAFEKTAAPADARGAMQDVAYRAMRQKGRADTLLGLLVKKAPPSQELHSLICCALALMCDSSGAGPRYDSFTVVDQAVTACAANSRIAHAKGMVNAVLRRFLREHAALLQQTLRQPVARWNYPAWWIDVARSSYPEEWQHVLEVGNQPPPLTLRVNRRRTGADAYLQLLVSSGMNADRIGDSAVRLQRAVPVSHIPGFNEGLVSVQDAAAQLAAPLLDLADGMRVLDACAAPGGKTGHLLELAEIELLALDSDPSRLARIDENLQRLQLHASLKTGDASGTDWWDGRAFDRILADVPCTASGIVRRHPDIRWLRREDDTEQLATLSARILDNLWQMLRPGGKLLFVTCSVWPRESEMQATAFGRRHGAIRLPAPGQLLPMAETKQDHDGLFYALFQKASA